jgi:hypothetical protein
MIELGKVIPLRYGKWVIPIKSVKRAFGKFSNLQLSQGLFETTRYFDLNVLLPWVRTSLTVELLKERLL